MTRATKAPLSMRPAKPWAVVAAGAATLLAAASGGAADSLRVGRPSARGFAGVPLVTGVKHGFFRNQGLDLELSVLGGGRTSP
jgi:ABC-type nitrate/sulfonate/bicarbonate transport system substrate-binding protein